MKRILATLFTGVILTGCSLPTDPHYLAKLTPANGWDVPLEANLSEVGERFSSPAVGDIDGDGVMDVVAGFPNGRVYAWRTDTGERWLEHWTGPGAVQASWGWWTTTTTAGSTSSSRTPMATSVCSPTGR